MATLLQCINQFIDKITPSDLQEDVVQGAYDNLEGYLTSNDCKLKIKEVFLNGSYIRGTMIRPINDIDVFAVIDDSDYYVNGQVPNPQTVLTSFKNYLNNIPDYKDKCRQDRPCITIDLSKLHIDVLPALRQAGALSIPDSSLTHWIFTDPKTHNLNFSDLDRRCNYKAKDIVKAVKRWKNDRDLPLPSFKIEVIAISIFNIFPFKNAEEGIRLWFDHAEGYLTQEMTGSYNRFVKVRDSIRATKEKINEAKAYTDDGKPAEAIKIWKEIFRTDFPTVDVNEARSFGKAIKDGSLKWSASAGLSTAVGSAIAASKGFYGEDTESPQGE